MNAQDRKTDSLRKLLRKAPEDTTKIKTLIRFADLICRHGNCDSSLICLEQAMVSAKKLGYARGIVWAHMYLAIAYDDLGNYPQAIRENQQGILAAKEHGYQKELGSLYNNLGYVYLEQGNYSEAMTQHFLALKIKEQNNDLAGIAETRHNLGNLYYYQDQYEEALREYLAALKVFEKLGDKRNMAMARNNIGNTYDSQKKYEDALREYLIALKLNEDINDMPGIAGTHSNIGIIYDEQGNFAMAINEYTKALEKMQDMGDQQGVAGVRIDLGQVYLSMKKYAEAAKELNQGLSIALAIGSKDILKYAYFKLAKVDSVRGDFKSALEHYSLSIKYRDSMINEDNTKQLVRQQMQYDFSKKEDAVRAEQDRKDAVADADKKRQKIILWSVSVFGILVLGFALFAYRSFLQKKKANIEIIRQKELIEEKQKEILDSIYYARRIQRSLIPTDKHIEKLLRARK